MFFAFPTRYLGCRRAEVGVASLGCLMEWLVTVPAKEVAAKLRGGQPGNVGGDDGWVGCGVGQELHVAAGVQQREPPGGGIKGLADRDQAVVLEDDCLVRSEGLGDAAAVFGVEHETGVVVEDFVVLEEWACVLG